ncbi:MAG: methionyl-tRNA formyltransferase [Actinomycetota bacterium]|nr:methionyl-tRNA formyltransferase [Actinomycetota bacterium]
MRVVFMGSPEFAVPALQALNAAHQVVAVYTQPDKVRRRGRELVPTAVKQAALELGVEVFEPRTLRDADEITRLSTMAPDVICVAAYGMILPPDVLAIPAHGCVNVHASLLPRHRGAAPIHRAILEGDHVVGVSIMRMEEGLDTGPFALTAQTRVGDSDVTSLTETLATLGAEALMETLDAIENGTVTWIAQDDSIATYASKISDSDLALYPDLRLVDAIRRVRASSPSARSKLAVAGRTIDVVRASASTESIAPGTLQLGSECLLVGFADGAMCAQEVRPEGKQVMSGRSFALGARIADPVCWERA